LGGRLGWAVWFRWKKRSGLLRAVPRTLFFFAFLEEKKIKGEKEGDRKTVGEEKKVERWKP
jgi:hypothetical protein